MKVSFSIQPSFTIRHTHIYIRIRFVVFYHKKKTDKKFWLINQDRVSDDHFYELIRVSVIFFWQSSLFRIFCSFFFLVNGKKICKDHFLLYTIFSEKFQAIDPCLFEIIPSLSLSLSPPNYGGDSVTFFFRSINLSVQTVQKLWQKLSISRFTTLRESPSL